MWTKALYDLGYIGHDEPYKRLVNQGMIQGSSRFIYRISTIFLGEEQLKWNLADHNIPAIFISFDIYKRFLELPVETSLVQQLFDSVEDDRLPIKGITGVNIEKFHVHVEDVDGVILDKEKFIDRKPNYADAIFITEKDGRYTTERNAKYICGSEVEKMSKSKFNTVNPDDLVWNYGSDTFRMYEMFLGPVEMSKPWDTKGIEGVHRFLKKLWRLFFKEPNSPSFEGGKGEAVWTDEPPSEAELKALHKTIKQIEEVTERFSFNTGVSGFMIAVNELTDLKCHKKAILEKLVILVSPYAPHIAEELWSQLGNSGSVLGQSYPVYDPKYLVESSKEYPISINGKMRTTIDIALGIPEKEVEKIVLENEVVKKWLEGKQPRKIIYKEGKMVNVVV